MLRKPDDIKRFLQQQKELNQRKKERELKRYRKAQEQTKKQLKKVSKKVEQTPEKPLKFNHHLSKDSLMKKTSIILGKKSIMMIQVQLTGMYGIN